MEGTKPKEVYRAEVWGKAPDTSNFTLVGHKVPEGLVVKIMLLIGTDITTAAKTIRVGYDRGGHKYWLKEEPAGTNVHGVWLNRPLYLEGGEAPAIMVESPTANDEIYLHARGPYV